MIIHSSFPRFIEVSTNHITFPYSKMFTIGGFLCEFQYCFMLFFLFSINIFFIFFLYHVACFSKLLPSSEWSWLFFAILLFWLIYLHPFFVHNCTTLSFYYSSISLRLLPDIVFLSMYFSVLLRYCHHWSQYLHLSCSQFLFSYFCFSSCVFSIRQY